MYIQPKERLLLVKLCCLETGHGQWPECAGAGYRLPPAMGVQCSSTVTWWQLQTVDRWVCYWTPLAGGGRPLDTGHNTSLCASGWKCHSRSLRGWIRGYLIRIKDGYTRQPGRNRRLRVLSRGALSRLSLRPHAQCCRKIAVNGRIPGSNWPKLQMLQGRFRSLGNRGRIYGPRRAAAGSGNNALAHHLQRPPIAVAYWFSVWERRRQLQLPIDRLGIRSGSSPTHQSNARRVSY
jgi:hypothetical protein